jgi:hypothetical protein
MAWEKPGVQTVIAETTARNIKSVAAVMALFQIAAICAFIGDWIDRLDSWR